MEIREKIETALRGSIPVHFLDLEEDDGISGYVVSPRFNNLRSLQRQELIDQILIAEPHRLTRAERRQVIMIAALTPAEFGSKSNSVCITDIIEINPNTFKIILCGGIPEAEVVCHILNQLPNVKIDQPQPVLGSDDQIFLIAKLLTDSQLVGDDIRKYLEESNRINLAPQSTQSKHPA